MRTQIIPAKSYPARKLSTAITALLFAIGLSATTARADLVTLTINNPMQNALQGTTLDYYATVAAPATNSNPVYLNGDNINSTLPSSVTVDDSPFDNNFPLSLAPGTSFTGLLFDIVIPPDLPIATYTGTFALVGGPDSSTFNTL